VSSHPGRLRSTDPVVIVVSAKADGEILIMEIIAKSTKIEAEVFTTFVQFNVNKKIFSNCKVRTLKFP
jgi:hypothetical protein